MKKTLIMAVAALLMAGAAMAQQENPRGLYKLQKFIYDDGKEQVPPFNQYKYLTDDLSAQIELVENDVIAAFQMVNQDKHPLNYTGKVPVGEDGQGLQIYDSNKEKFTLRWYNNFAPNSAIFPFNAFISEEYSSKKGISPTMKEIIDIIGMKGKVKKSNKFTGVWKRRGMSDRVDGKGQLFEMTTMYKVYTDTKMLMLEGDLENAPTMAVVGHLWPCTFYTDRLITEGQNSCMITWINDNTFTLIWISGGYPAVEIWDRTELPELMQKTFK